MKPFCSPGSLIVFLALSILTAPGRAADEKPLVEFHFLGTEATLASEDATKFKELAALTFSRPLQMQTRQRMVRWLPEILLFGEDVVGSTISAPLYPLVETAWQHESYLRIEGDSMPPRSWAFAAHVGESRLNEFTSGVRRMARELGYPAATNVELIEGVPAKQITFPDSHQGLVVATLGEWFVAGNSIDGVLGELASEFQKTGRPIAHPGEHWFRFKLDLQKVDWRPALLPTEPLPFLDLTHQWQSGGIRTEMRIVWPEDQQWRIDPWQLPLETLRDPIVGFTAMNNLRDYLARLDFVKLLSPAELPNQAVWWVDGEIPFKSEGAFPLKNPAAFRQMLANKLPNLMDPPLLERGLGKLQVSTNDSSVLWRGLPLFVPFARTVTEANGEFAYFGLFPVTAAQDKPPVPDALLDQFRKRDDLVYYDWEYTQARLQQFRKAEPFTGLIFRDVDLSEKGIANKWLEQATPLLGNTVTEIARVNDREALLVRKSDAFFTGFEWYLLALWLDGGEFPEFPLPWPRPLSEIRRTPPNASPAGSTPR